MIQFKDFICLAPKFVLAFYDSKALAFNLSLTSWKRFCDNLLIVWTHGSASRTLGYHNKIYETGKMEFTMQVSSNEEFKFLDQKLKMGNGKISVNVFSKLTNSFT